MQLIVGAAAISALGLTTINTIRDNLTPAQLQRAAIYTGDEFLVTADNAAPETYLDDDTSPVIIKPTRPGTKHCEGNTGALLCSITLPLSGSGGQRKYTAASYTCSTATCSLLGGEVFTEATPRGDKIYVGYAAEPATKSGSQLLNYVTTVSGGTLRFAYTGATVPVGHTFKAVFAHEQPGKVVGAITLRWIEYYRP